MTSTDAGASSTSGTMGAATDGAVGSGATSGSSTSAATGGSSTSAAAGADGMASNSVTGGMSSSATAAGVGGGGTSSSTTAGGAGNTGSDDAGTTDGGTTGGGGPVGIPGNEELLVPDSGALLGVFTPAQSQGELASSESQVGRKWAIHLGYFDWGLDFRSFAQADIDAGRIPYVTIEPWNVSLDSIASGAQDSVIQSRASGIRELPGKIMLRFAHEMNGDWYPWGGFENGADTGAPAKYVAAYRRVHDGFEAAGASNVLWVFCPNVDSVPNESWNQWENYYPGDEYVDWMCYDGYDWGSDTFVSMTSRIYAGLAAMNKPILLGETSTEKVEKATWIAEIIPAMQNQFPMLKALVWFHVNKENDWRYDSTQGSLGAFIEMANDPYFNP